MTNDAGSISPGQARMRMVRSSRSGGSGTGMMRRLVIARTDHDATHLARYLHAAGGLAEALLHEVQPRERLLAYCEQRGKLLRVLRAACVGGRKNRRKVRLQRRERFIQPLLQLRVNLRAREQ